MRDLAVRGVGLVLADDLPGILVAVIVLDGHAHAEAYDAAVLFRHGDFRILAPRVPIAQVARGNGDALAILLGFGAGQFLARGRSLRLDHGEALRRHQVAMWTDGALTDIREAAFAVLFPREC